MDVDGKDVMESLDEESERRMGRAQELASRATDYVQSTVKRGQDLVRAAGDRLTDLTGRPVESWPGEARRLIQGYPLQAIAVAVGLGYVLGKVLRRG